MNPPPLSLEVGDLITTLAEQAGLRQFAAEWLGQHDGERVTIRARPRARKVRVAFALSLLSSVPRSVIRDRIAAGWGVTDRQANKDIEAAIKERSRLTYSRSASKLSTIENNSEEC